VKKYWGIQLLHDNIRQLRKGPTVTNTLAYNDWTKSTTVKSFTVLATGKLFVSFLMLHRRTKVSQSFIL